MNARFLTTATLTTLFAGVLPATAADPQLLNLVMPDAKVLAGVNVDQAKTSPFGQYVLSQMQLHDTHLTELTTATGFDPTRDVHELLVAPAAAPASKPAWCWRAATSTPPGSTPLALSKGAASEVYKGVTIRRGREAEERFRVPERHDRGRRRRSQRQGRHRPADRRPASLPAPVTVQVNQWSSTQDAWAVITVPPTSLHPAAGMPPIPGMGPANQNNAFQGIQQAAGGVKFGTNVVVTAQAQAATAQDATQIGDTLKLLASLAQMQSNGDPG